MAENQGLTVDQLTAQVAKRATWLKIGAAAVVAALLLPLLVLVLKAVVVGIALGTVIGVAGVAAWLIYMFSDVMIDKVKNKRIQLIIEEAKRNPIPTLWNLHVKDGNEIEEMARSIQEYDVAIQNVRSKVTSAQADMEASDLRSFEQDLVMMEKDLELQYSDLAELRMEFKKQERAIKRAETIWNVGMAMKNANDKNRSAQARTTLDRIREETALESIASKMNSGKAALRARIEHRSAEHSAPRVSGYVEQVPVQPPAIENKPSPVIDIQTKQNTTAMSNILRGAA